MTSEEPLVLGDVVDDLGLILGAVEDQYARDGSASYESVQREVSDQIRLHLLSYVRFLEGESLLEYDRISDEMRVTDEGRSMRASPEGMSQAASVAFGEHLSQEVAEAEEASTSVLSAEAAFSDMFDDMAAEMDSALDAGPSLDDDSDADEAFGGAASGGDVFGAVSGGGAGGAFAQAVEPEPVEKVGDGGYEGPASENYEEDSMNGQSNAPVSGTGWSANVQGDSMQQDGAFERIEEIGSGGIGTVFRGNQVRLNREVAIKEVREIFNVFAGVQRDQIIERFCSIVQTQASLLHSNIIQVIDVDTTGEYPFAVMQLAPNGNLRRLIDHGERPPLAVALKYFLQILHALNTAHEQGVVHGSIKPENVVLDQAGNALVTDFGISKIVEREGGRGNQVYVGVGTVAYMSPEQFQDPNLASIKSDIYSLGIMFYEMLTGKVPGRRSPMPSSFFPDIPRALDDIFDRMCMDREEDRYDSIASIIADIYDEDEVLDILDKRSGVLFLRDPMEHGESGLGGSTGGAAAAPAQAQEPSEVEALAPDSEDDFDEDSEDYEDSEVDEVESEESDEVSEDEEYVDEEEDFDEDDVEDDEDDEDGDDDVLGKLDKYGELFDEEEEEVD